MEVLPVFPLFPLFPLLPVPTNCFGLSTTQVELLQGKDDELVRGLRKRKNLQYFCKQERNQQKADSPHFDSVPGKGHLAKSGTALHWWGKDECLYTMRITHDLQCITHYTMCINRNVDNILSKKFKPPCVLPMTCNALHIIQYV